MSRTTLSLTPQLAEYVVAMGPPIDEIQRDLIEETSRLGDIARMQIAPEQGAFMTMMTKLVGAQFAVEVGTFTGYSSLAVARGLAPGGRLLCCDINEEWTSIARSYWDRAGVADRIELRLAPALTTLRELPLEPRIDISFIDADKTGYRGYWDEIVPRTRSGGVILVDNVLQGGKVIDSNADGDDVVAIRAFNSYVREDDRVDQVLLPLADGLTFARKK